MDPLPWTQSAQTASFWPRLRAARRSVLMLDYDGTLAPFKNDPREAFPYTGIAERLVALADLPKVRLVLVSGRSARGLAELLASIPDVAAAAKLKVEIWGNHGRERLKADGSYDIEPLNPLQMETMERLKSEIAQIGFAHVLEAKPASLAIHWRGLDPASQRQISSLAESLYAQHVGESKLHLVPFDGGVELRSTDRDKGAAVEQILAEEGAAMGASSIATADRPAAYLGDDLTDEDAFRALGNRGLSILVREQSRPSSAQFWIRPPKELLEFLDGWLQCAGSSSSASGVPGRSTL